LNQSVVHDQAPLGGLCRPLRNREAVYSRMSWRAPRPVREMVAAKKAVRAHARRRFAAPATGPAAKELMNPLLCFRRQSMNQVPACFEHRRQLSRQAGPHGMKFAVIASAMPHCEGRWFLRHRSRFFLDECEKLSARPGYSRWSEWRDPAHSPCEIARHPLATRGFAASASNQPGVHRVLVGADRRIRRPEQWRPQGSWL
jgi:hypothetical protein